MLKKWIFSCFITCCAISAVAAENPPLRVAVPAFSPPFVMQGTPQHYYGFDIEIIEAVCKKLERRCEYMPMAFDDLLPALTAEKADVAIGGLMITLKRSDVIRFSAPYLVSKAQFIAAKKTPIKTPFEMRHLAGEKLGVLTDGAFSHTVRLMSQNKPKLTLFKQDSDIISALNTHQINLALLNLPKARYWESNSGGVFKEVGAPFPVGFGFAIAISPNNLSLIKPINFALFEYQESTQFKKNYDLYIKSRF